MVERAHLFLEDEEFGSADQYAEKALDRDPKCAEAYLVKLMAELKVRTEEELGVGAEPLTDNSLYKKALRFSSGALRQRIEACNHRRQEEARRKQLERERREQLTREAEERERQTRLEQERRKKVEKERQEQKVPCAEGLAPPQQPPHKQEGERANE